MPKSLFFACLILAASPAFAQAIDDYSPQGTVERMRNADMQAEQDHQHEQIFDQQMQMQQMQLQLDNQRAQQRIDGPYIPPAKTRDEGVDARNDFSQIENEEVDAGVADVSGDHKTAIILWRSLADRGDAVAQFSLGDILDNGRGQPQLFQGEYIVPQDYVKAYMWYTLAAENPIISQKTRAGEAKFLDNIAVARDKLVAKMTPEELAEAQRLMQKRKLDNAPLPAKGEEENLPHYYNNVRQGQKYIAPDGSVMIHP